MPIATLNRTLISADFIQLADGGCDASRSGNGNGSMRSATTRATDVVISAQAEYIFHLPNCRLSVVVKLLPR